jgi:hypothetical protein
MYEDDFYVNVAGRTFGPVSRRQILDALRSGRIPQDADICRVGDSLWRSPRELGFIQADAAPPPTPVQTTPSEHPRPAPAAATELPTVPRATAAATPAHAGLIVSAIVAFVSTATIGLIGVVQLFNGAMRWNGAWNIFIAAIYAAIGAGILQRRRMAFDWGVGSNVLNIISAVVLAVLGEPSVFLCLIPLWIGGTVSLAMSAHQFPAKRRGKRA